MMVVPLDESLDAERFGGKAAGLAAALRGGLPVPPGLALTVDMVQALAAGSSVAVTHLEAAWPSLRPPVAVRSSAVGEDSGQASFAGQHLTCLNVRSLRGALEAVRAVWQSANSSAALAYRERLGLPPTPRVGVVVQQLIHAHCAGVLFTRNPIDGADEIVVEAAWGLGEAVVGGLVTPDRFTIARNGSVRERTAGEKDVAIRIAPVEGTEQVPVPPERVRAFCLDDRELAELVRLARRCEAVFPGARDLEWAFADDTAYLLQCRWITRASSGP